MSSGATVSHYLACAGYRVICPDTIGRGLSQWRPMPQAEYCLAFNAQIAADF